MNAVLYLRKSRADDPGEAATLTLRRHEEALRELAARRELTIIGVYREVVSGDKLAARIEMCRLLADCAHPAFQAVLCMDIDRLGRGSMAEQGQILDTFKAAGVCIITPRKDYDLQNDLDETYSEFESFIARQELKIIKRRLQRGVAHSAGQGSFLSAPPYGYCRATVDGHPSLAPEAGEAEAVALIFSLYVEEGLGGQQIADRLNAMGYLPRRAASFTPGSILAVLANPVYTGRVVRHGANPIDVPGLHPPLVSPALFAEAQAKRHRRTPPKSGPRTRQNPLAGLVLCAHCGSRLQRLPAGPSRRQETLACPQRGCNVASRLSAVEQAVARAVLSRLPPQFTPKPQKPLDPTATRRAQLTGQQERLYTLLEQGVYTTEEYTRRRRELTAQLAALPSPQPSGTPPPAINTAEIYATATPADKNAFLHLFLSHITYEKAPGAPPEAFILDLYWKE